jgi:hypothetical protein
MIKTYTIDADTSEELDSKIEDVTKYYTDEQIKEIKLDVNVMPESRLYPPRLRFIAMVIVDGIRSK